ncbi:MAG: cytochrome c [Rhodospirillales bacterium]|nr:cytochrome c [Rhodospirillales bacterium]
MKTSPKRMILGSFCAAFAVYSAYVWTAATDIPQHRPPGDQVKAGLALFQEKNCIACHQLYGLGGHMGPDLTNVVSAPDKGVDHAKAFIESGTSKMPNFNLGEKQVDALVQFLKFVDSSGTYPAKTPEMSWYGTVAYGAAKHTQ